MTDGGGQGRDMDENVNVSRGSQSKAAYIHARASVITLSARGQRSGGNSAQQRPTIA